MFCTLELMSMRFSRIALIVELWYFSLFWEVTANIADWQSGNIWRLSFEGEILSLAYFVAIYISSNSPS